MMTIETKPTDSTGMVIRHNEGWLAYEGRVILGIIQTDCVACAERERDALFPGAKLAAICPEGGNPQCFKDRPRTGVWIPFANDKEY